MRDERLTREDADRLEREIVERRKREFKEALLELLKESPEAIYACVVEVMRRHRTESDRRILARARHLRELAVLVILALVALTWYWTRH